MAATIKIIKQAPKKVVPATTASKKIIIKKKTADPDAEPAEPLRQKFLATHSERGITITFGNMKFGVMQGESKSALENFMRGSDAKDTQKIQGIVSIVKTYMKANISYETICKRLNDSQLDNFSQTLQTYLNAISKPAPITPIIKISTLETHPHINHYGDDNHSLTDEIIHLHI